MRLRLHAATSISCVPALLCAVLQLGWAGCGRARPDAAATAGASTGEAGAPSGQAGGTVRDARGRVSRSFTLPAHPSLTEPGCTAVVRLPDLPWALRETSGIAVSRAHPGILWTQTDSDGGSTINAVDTTGRLVGRLAVPGARNVDWEDIAVGPCAAGQARPCLYVGDIGDNDRKRTGIVVYRLAEPDPAAPVTVRPDSVALVYPDGPHDAEALYVLPDGSINIVTKGHSDPVALYRFAGRPAPGPNRLTRIQVLVGGRTTVDRKVTGADATADGRWVVIRTYGWLEFYHPDARGRLTPVLGPPGVPLEDAGEPQGEGVAFGRNATIWLSTEGGPFGGAAFVSRLDCRLP